MKNLKRYRVRFHLAKGDHFMQWQVFDKLHNTKEYYDPNKRSIIMRDCLLGNHAATAKKFSAETIKQCVLGLHAMRCVS